MACWPGLKGDMDGFVENCAGGYIMWLTDDLEPWERYMETDELVLRSLFEFCRAELNARQIAALEEWEASWIQFRDRDVFHQRVREEGGGRFTWEGERQHAERRLGRPIPKSHWWFWAPEEAKK